MGLTSVEDNIKERLKVCENAHIMLVEGMSKIRTTRYKRCQSSVFHISGHKWKLIVHPDGKNRTSDYLSLYLRIKDKASLQKESRGSNWEVKCIVTLKAISQSGYDHKCHSTERSVVCYNGKQAIYGREEFITHKMLKEGGYLVNDKVVFCAEVSNVQSNCAVTPIPRTMGTAERLKLIDVPRHNCKFTWKITQFSSFDGEKDYFSLEFPVGPRRWKLRMCPKRNANGKGYLSLYLDAANYVTNGPKAKTLAFYKLRVLDQLHRKHWESTSWGDLFHYDPLRRRASWGWDQFLPLDSLNNPSLGFLVDDQIYLSVEFFFVSTTESL